MFFYKIMLYVEKRLYILRSLYNKTLAVHLLLYNILLY